jgi:hypothetical protein
MRGNGKRAARGQIDLTQRRAEHESHEHIDPGPHHAAHDMDEIQEKDVAEQDRRRQHGEGHRDIAQMTPPNEAGPLFRRHAGCRHDALLIVIAMITQTLAAERRRACPAPAASGILPPA